MYKKKNGTEGDIGMTDSFICRKFDACRELGCAAGCRGCISDELANFALDLAQENYTRGSRESFAFYLVEE